MSEALTVFLPPHEHRRLHTSNRIEPQQPLRRNRRPPEFSVNIIERVIHPPQRLVRHRPDRPQRVIGRHQIIEARVREYLLLLTVL